MHEFFHHEKECVALVLLFFVHSATSLVQSVSEVTAPAIPSTIGYPTQNNLLDLTSIIPPVNIQEVLTDAGNYGIVHMGQVNLLIPNYRL